MNLGGINLNVKTGDNSVVNQIHGKTTIQVSEECAKQIIRDVLPEIKMYNDEAMTIAESRLNDAIDKFTNKIAEKDSMLFERFRRPSVQVALNAVYREYIKTDDPDLGNDLLEMLYERIEEDEKTTKQLIIDQALQITPKLPKIGLSFLIFFYFTQVRAVLGNFDQFDFLMFNKMSQLLSAIGDVRQRDVEYLVSIGCFNVLPVQNKKNILLEHLFNNYKGVFCKNISREDFCEILKVYLGFLPKMELDQLMNFTQVESGLGLHNLVNLLKDICILSTENSNQFRFNIMNDLEFSDKMSKYEKSVDVIRNIYDKSLMSTSEIKSFFISHDVMWKNVFDLFEKEYVYSLRATPVCLYIASRNFEKLTGVSSPFDMFYKD